MGRCGSRTEAQSLVASVCIPCEMMMLLEQRLRPCSALLLPRAGGEGWSPAGCGIFLWGAGSLGGLGQQGLLPAGAAGLTQGLPFCLVSLHALYFLAPPIHDILICKQSNKIEK